jgi:ATP-dependent RNA helicase DHX37/DHR1
VHLGALTADKKQATALGKRMALFPVSPHWSRMLLVGQQHGCLDYVLTMVAAPSVGDPFLLDSALHVDDEHADEDGSDEQRHAQKHYYQARAEPSGKRPRSDLLRWLSAVGAFEYSGGSAPFCAQHFLRPKVCRVSPRSACASTGGCCSTGDARHPKAAGAAHASGPTASS